MANFFESRRLKLDLARVEIAARAGTTEPAVRNWEEDKSVPRTPIATLAIIYEVPESTIEKEVMAMRRRIEASKALATSK